MTQGDRIHIEPVERPEPDLDKVVLAILAALDEMAEADAEPRSVSEAAA